MIVIECIENKQLIEYIKNTQLTQHDDIRKIMRILRNSVITSKYRSECDKNFIEDNNNILNDENNELDEYTKKFFSTMKNKKYLDKETYIKIINLYNQIIDYENKLTELNQREKNFQRINYISDKILKNVKDRSTKIIKQNDNINELKESIINLAQLNEDESNILNDNYKLISYEQYQKIYQQIDKNKNLELELMNENFPIIETYDIDCEIFFYKTVFDKDTYYVYNIKSTY